MLQLASDFLRLRQSFTVETTLSGRTYLRMMALAHQLGYLITLIYIGTTSVEINIDRVRQRVLKGGHDVPVGDQRRRYPRSYANLPAALVLADEAILFDNSTEQGYALVALKQRAEMQWFEPIPVWAVKLKS